MLFRLLNMRLHVFLNSLKKKKGGGYSWDYAATICIFNELNQASCNFKGEKIELNPKGETFMNEKGVLFASDRIMMRLVRSKFTDVVMS